MATLKEEAQAYTSPQTLNIADLEKVPTDIQVKEKTAQDKEGKEFTYKYVEIEGKDYRVPNSVLNGLKAILQKMPGLQYIGVIKQGQGLATSYQVIPFSVPTEKVE